MPNRETPTLRRLRFEDVSQALHLSTLAGWNQTAEDWQLLLDVAGQSCFCIEADDAVVATATLVCYGSRFGFIGMVLTHPEYRSRGLARGLLEHVLTVADAFGIETLKLDATDQGEPLYRKLGFTSEQPIERWRRAGSASVERHEETSPGNLSSWFELDANAFGVDRSFLLKRLLRRGSCFQNSGGYLLSRSGRASRYLGPCFAENPHSARDLFRLAMTQSASQWSWDLFPGHRDAVALAVELGFVPQRHLSRMRRGPEVRNHYQKLYAIAGFELG